MKGLSTLVRRLTAPAMLFLIACSSYNTTEPKTRTFQLTSIGGVTLPAPVFDGMVDLGNGSTGHLVINAASGSFSLSPTGHYEQHVSHDSFMDGTLIGHLLRADRGECTTTGTALACDSGFIQNVQFTGTVSGNDVAIAQDIAGEGTLATYQYHQQ